MKANIENVVAKIKTEGDFYRVLAEHDETEVWFALANIVDDHGGSSSLGHSWFGYVKLDGGLAIVLKETSDGFRFLWIEPLETAEKLVADADLENVDDG